MYKGMGSKYKWRETAIRVDGGYKGNRGGRPGIKEGGADIRGEGSRNSAPGIYQHQEYIVTFNEVLNTSTHNRRHVVSSCFISFLQRTRFGFEYLIFLLFWPILK